VTEADVREAQVREAVARLVSAFGEGRLEDYFGSFHPDCSFIFHTTEPRLGSVEEYRALWRRWIREDGFEVLGCRTRNTSVQLWGEVAVVTHDVHTRVRTNDGEEDLSERETIVLARQTDGRWLGVHEHLSPRRS
jgi:ketosteroid isomerase-like protein